MRRGGNRDEEEEKLQRQFWKLTWMGMGVTNSLLYLVTRQCDSSKHDKSYTVRILFMVLYGSTEL